MAQILAYASLFAAVYVLSDLWRRHRDKQEPPRPLADAVHLIPVDDLIEHDTSGNPCVCGPDALPGYYDDGTVAYHVIHHSLDGREHSEPDHDREACPLCQCDRV